MEETLQLQTEEVVPEVDSQIEESTPEASSIEALEAKISDLENRRTEIEAEVKEAEGVLEGMQADYVIGGCTGKSLTTAQSNRDALAGALVVVERRLSELREQLSQAQAEADREAFLAQASEVAGIAAGAIDKYRESYREALTQFEVLVQRIIDSEHLHLETLNTFAQLCDLHHADANATLTELADREVDTHGLRELTLRSPRRDFSRPVGSFLPEHHLARESLEILQNKLRAMQMPEWTIVGNIERELQLHRNQGNPAPEPQTEMVIEAEPIITKVA